MCENEQINGVTRDGGYAEYVTLRTEAVVSIPKDADPAAYCSLLCAGVTVFNCKQLTWEMSDHVLDTWS